MVRRLRFAQFLLEQFLKFKIGLDYRRQLVIRVGQARCGGLECRVISSANKSNYVSLLTYTMRETTELAARR